MKKCNVVKSMLFVLFILTLLGMTAAQRDEISQQRGIFFSTEEDFVAGIRIPGGQVISDGDLLNSTGYVYMRNAQLLAAFGIKADLGLDAADVINFGRKFVVFSTELDHPQRKFTAGDLLATNGAVLPNAALLAAFKTPRDLDLGLDAVQIAGRADAIIEFFELVKSRGRDFWLQSPTILAEHLREYRIDILFSTEGTAPSPQQPQFLDGDLLSAATGSIVLSNSAALPAVVPAGIPQRGVDFGMDAIYCRQRSRNPRFFFSTEILYEEEKGFTDGDVLLQGDGIVMYNSGLIAAFKPRVKELGLDALSFFPDYPMQCGLTKIGGVVISPDTWDFSTGYVDPTAGAGAKDHTFGRWVSIRGNIPASAVEHRVMFRPAASGTDQPILMPANLGGPNGWRVYSFPDGVWHPVVISGDGWMWSDYWRYLKDDCGNPDLILVNWNTGPASVPDGKYILSLQVKNSTGVVTTCSEIPVQIDNTKPEVALKNNLECHKFNCKDMPLDVIGKIFDKHFYKYRLVLYKFGLVPPGRQFGEGFYNGGAPLNSQGTNGYPAWVTLAQLNIPSVLKKTCTQTPEGRYTVWLYAYDRSLLGGFTPATNSVSDAVFGNMHQRNYYYALTNFEFYH